jgi:hypothetical protein
METLASSNSPATDIYFCHECQTRMQPNTEPVLSCSRCNSEFVELIEDDADPEEVLVGDNSRGNFVDDFFNMLMQELVSNQERQRPSETSTTTTTTSAWQSATSFFSTSQGTSERSNASTSSGSTSTSHPTWSALTGFVSNLASNLFRGRNTNRSSTDAATSTSESTSGTFSRQQTTEQPSTFTFEWGRGTSGSSSNGASMRVWVFDTQNGGRFETREAPLDPNLFSGISLNTQTGSENANNTENGNRDTNEFNLFNLLRLFANQDGNADQNQNGLDNIMQLLQAISRMQRVDDNSSQIIDDLITQMLNQTGM